jgi:hypothetical protein
MIYRRVRDESQSKSVKNVIRVATIAFIIFFIQDFLSYPVASVIVYRGLTTLLGIIFYKYFQFASEQKGFEFSKIFPFYAIVIFSYGSQFCVCVCVDLNVRETALIP